MTLTVFYGRSAGFLSTFVICGSAAAQDCPDLAGIHDLLPRIDNQIAGPGHARIFRWSAKVR